MTSLATILQTGRVWRGASVCAGGEAGLASGFAALDAELPGGGWPAGAFTEILPAHEGIGELRILGPALARLGAQGRTLVWIAPPYLPYAPALAAAGIALAHIAIVRTRNARDALWAAEQALRSNACGAVLCWLERPRYPELRRLQVAAEGGGAAGFVFRAPAAAGESSPAPLRLSLRTEAGGLAVHILKRRGGPLAQPVLIPALGAPFSSPYAQQRMQQRTQQGTQQGTQQRPHPHALDRLSPAAAAARTVRIANA
jgi:cell division inhibitor SulA/protein ImuA